MTEVFPTTTTTSKQKKEIHITCLLGFLESIRNNHRASHYSYKLRLKKIHCRRLISSSMPGEQEALPPSGLKKDMPATCSKILSNLKTFDICLYSSVTLRIVLRISLSAGGLSALQCYRYGIHLDSILIQSDTFKMYISTLWEDKRSVRFFYWQVKFLI